MQGAEATVVPLFDVAGFAEPVEWTFASTGAAGKKLRVREENGKLLLEFLNGGTIVVFR